MTYNDLKLATNMAQRSLNVICPSEFFFPIYDSTNVLNIPHVIFNLLRFLEIPEWKQSPE